ncbi:MAG TPA: type II secretion system protein N [Candidatus Tenderia electrophaga]|uniref:Type II secretion system protein N n=1 Tax=Candidatus Tenderia electrophaga TaxID=1748243 RepID=A0A832J4D3_9GAMM|nr:type II secretion system protein N [Candidatus Tenderia electrophaga]
MMRIVAYIVLGLLAFAGFLLATFPAQRGFALLAEQAPQLRAAGLSGTVWSGKAGVLQVGDRNLEKLQWQLKPWSVLFGQLELDVRLDGADVAGQASIGLKPDGAIRLTDVDLRLSAAEMSKQFKVPVDLGGQFNVQLHSAELMGQKLQSAEGVIRWQRAALVSPFAQPMGEFVARLSTEADVIKAQVKDDGGPLQLDGVAKLTPDGRYDFNGSVSVRDAQQKLLVQGVRAMGRPGKDGRVPLRYSGRL